MTPQQPLRILVNAPTPPGILEEVAALSPRISILGAEDLKEEPALIGEIEIVYGDLASEQWAEAKSLKWYQLVGAGVDDLLTAEVIAHPVVITNAHMHARAISEHLFSMLFMLTRRLHIAYCQQLAQKWDKSSFTHGGLDTLLGKTLGVVGLGAVGSSAAQIGVALGMRVLGLDQARRELPDVDTVYSPERKLEMLAQCDYIMVTLPLTSATRHFISQHELQSIKPGALLFNVGRGGTIDTDVMVAALQSGKLGGAGLDVVDPQPLPADHPLWTMPNVIITPHYAGMYRGYFADSGRIFLDNLRRYLDGKPLLNVVDKDAGY